MKKWHQKEVRKKLKNRFWTLLGDSPRQSKPRKAPGYEIRPQNDTKVYPESTKSKPEPQQRRSRLRITAFSNEKSTFSCFGYTSFFHDFEAFQPPPKTLSGSLFSSFSAVLSGSCFLQCFETFLLSESSLFWKMPFRIHQTTTFAGQACVGQRTGPTKTPKKHGKKQLYRNM